MTAAVTNRWIRVNKRNVCPVYGKPDWCLISQDGKAMIAKMDRATTAKTVTIALKNWSKRY